MRGIYKILLVKALLLVFFNQGIQEIITSSDVSFQLIEVPVIDITFYMMGREEADANSLKLIRENVEYLNLEFEGSIKFEINSFFVNQGHALLPDLHKEYFSVEELTVDKLVKDIENKGSINVFIFDSYIVEEMQAELMGFTPIFRASFKDYETSSPSFDRIFLSYNALVKQTTLVHEMGHFLGLDHPWEMTEINKDLMGLSDKNDVQNNHMAYGLHVEKFTYEQLERMQHFALKFREYLVDRKEYFVNNQLVSTSHY